jgi:vacuolar iron transporter family protein
VLATRLAEKPDQMLRTLVHKELGLSEESFPNPLVAAISATVSMAIGAFITIIPFFFMQGIAAALVSLAAHFAVGAAKTLVTGCSWFYSGAEMMVVGAIKAVITYVLGAAFRGI